MSAGEEHATFVVIGGGIAGVSCAEMLPFHSSDEKVILITASSLIKAVTNVVPYTKMLFDFDVEEKAAETLSDKHPNVSIIHDTVIKLDAMNHRVFTENGACVSYKKLCICTGGRPKLITEGNKFVIGIRDVDSVKDLQRRIQKARRVVVVGNGGIATEVVYEIEGVEMVWAIKDKHISAPYIDPGAAQFLLSRLDEGKGDAKAPCKRMKYTVSSEQHAGKGAALGPDWHANYDMEGSFVRQRAVTVEYNTEVTAVREGDAEWPVYVELNNGKVYGCDFVISATGVTPNVAALVQGNSLEVSADGGLAVDERLETSAPDVFAAGDACTAAWEAAPHWFQMRLWRQAWQMGAYAAKTMSASLASEPVVQDFCFELFSHVTRFFGLKVVLLGLYNGQRLQGQYEVLLRVTPREEYVKLVVREGRLQGAVLVGETDLEEMCENLILNQIDITGIDILDPRVDIEDYFD
ncbi:pyridine nucleotide-disulfide oxidoreductase domain-containing protein 1 [Bacillus rossius redtenbacheri]|uniref:pyridine nucleotide-disulfide oxidoreductase domain-containing protein 1 n=1 Tax=Bacillus rossius redtenbacheri TaxID=93214 RepID=UPI002FDE5882